MRLSKSLAFALIRAWQADYTLARMDDALLDELKEKFGGVFFKMRVRTFIGSYAKPVSELCFDKKFQSAAILLMKQGFDTKKSTYENQLQAARISVHFYEDRKKHDSAETNAKYAAHRRCNQWSVCK